MYLFLKSVLHRETVVPMDAMAEKKKKWSLNRYDLAPTKYYISNSLLMDGPIEINGITHQCIFSPVVNTEYCLAESETNLCTISCEDICSYRSFGCRSFEFGGAYNNSQFQK